MFYCALRPLLFKCDPESIHDRVLELGLLARAWPARQMLKAIYGFEHADLAVELFGLKFKNPFGLAAGFDKNCQAYDLLAALGFGHIEFGTVTAIPQQGNDKPRIFRFPADNALINRMGFPSWGAEKVAQNMKNLRRGPGMPVVGLNIGKSKVVPIDGAVEDYLTSFRILRGLADYYVVNVSSPNTPELRKLQEKGRLSELLGAIQNENNVRAPLLVKIAPDLSENELQDVLECCASNGISGVIATNTTLSRNGLGVETSQAGGLSGKPLTARAREVVSYLSGRADSLPIIGAGGVMNSSDAYEMLRSGARLVQVYTGLVYAGPGFVKSLKVEILNILRQNGFVSLTDILPKYN